MLSRLILTIIQLALGWFAAPFIIKYVPNLGQLNIFAYAVVFAILVWIIGFIGSIVLKEVGAPSSSTLTLGLVLALVFAGLTLVPQVMAAVAGVVQGVPTLMYPLIGAVLGYAIRR